MKKPITKQQYEKLLQGQFADIVEMFYQLKNSQQVAKKMKLSIRCIHNRLIRAGNEIGIEQLTPLQINKCALVEMYKSGKSVKQIMKIGGYKHRRSVKFLEE